MITSDSQMHLDENPLAVVLKDQDASQEVELVWEWISAYA